MRRYLSSGLVVGMVLATLCVGATRAEENAGLEDLDNATEQKLDARSLADLAVVIDLCDSALKKGLDEPNTEFANDLLVATLIQRATVTARVAFQGGPVSAQWRRLRKMAVTDLDRAVKLRPEHAEAWILLAQLNLLPGGDSDRVGPALDEAVRHGQDDPDLHVQTLLMRAEYAEDLDAKMADLNEVLKVQPKHAGALRMRAMVHDAAENPEEALADLDAAIALEPDHINAHQAKIDILLAEERNDEAEKVIEKLFELVEDSAIPYIQRARFFGIQEKYEEALDDLNEAEEIDPANPLIFLLRASVLAQLDRNEEAMGDVDRLLRLRPGLPEGLRLKTALLAGAGDFDEAIKQLETLRLMEPDDIAVKLQLAFAYGAEEQYDKAVELFTEILDQEPENEAALQGRADVLLSSGQQAEAIADYERALKLTPEDVTVLNNLAWVLATSPDEKLRDGPRAQKLAETACELTDYKAGYILSTLAATHAEQGDFKTAIRWAKKAVKLAKDDEDRQTMTKELDSYQENTPWRELQEPEVEPSLPGLEEIEE